MMKMGQAPIVLIGAMMKMGQAPIVLIGASPIFMAGTWEREPGPVFG
jgi:hypothetical protein